MAESKWDLLDRFGRQIMSDVRDEPFQHLEMIIAGKMADARSKELYRQYQSIDPEARRVLERFLAVAIDACLARFLNYFDERAIGILFQTENGDSVDVRRISDGLVGGLYNETGWIAKFSRFGDRVEPCA
jgi:hypothetical protein